MTDTITRILVPTDFGDHSDAALAYAAGLASRLGASLELVHIVDDPVLAGAWSGEAMILSNVQKLLDELMANARARLAVTTAALAETGVTATATVVAGIPGPAIVDRALAGKFDLIVMGTHGRTGLSHLVIGSVAERVLRTAPCAVLTVKAGKSPKVPAEQRGTVVL